MLRNLHEPKRFKRMRESSYDRSGGNADYVPLNGGEHHALSLSGPETIRHIWMTLAGESEDIYKELELVMTFDDFAEPQVQVPSSDFFLFGHGLLVDVDSVPIQVSRQSHITDEPYKGGLNCCFPMPFERSAAIEFRNTGGIM